MLDAALHRCFMDCHDLRYERSEPAGAKGATAVIAWAKRKLAAMNLKKLVLRKPRSLHLLQEATLLQCNAASLTG